MQRESKGSIPRRSAELDHIAFWSEASTRKYLENEGRVRGKKKALPLPELGISLVPRNLMEFYSINYFSFIGFICSEHYLRSRPCFLLSPKQRSNRKAGDRGRKPCPVPTMARNIPLALFFSTSLSFSSLTPPSFPKKTVKDITGLEGFKLEWGGEKYMYLKREKTFFPMPRAQVCTSGVLPSTIHII